MAKNYEKNDFLRNGLQPKMTEFDIISGKEYLNFPTNIFPEYIENIMIELDRTAGYEKAVTGAGILFTISSLIGNSKKVKIKNTWTDTPNLWLAVVGKRGTAKTPALNFVLNPLKRDEIKFGEEFRVAITEWDKLDKEEKTKHFRPVRRQRFSNDTTIEGLIVAMKDNPNGMGIYKDELSGFFNSMNRYSKSGGDLEFYLSSWSGGVYIKNRVSYEPITVDNIFLSIIGNIQPSVLRSIATDQNTQNGMIDRWLYVEIGDEERVFTIDDIDDSVIEKYTGYIESIKDLLRDGQEYLNWDDGSLLLFEQGMNKIEKYSQDDDISDSLAAYLSKIAVYFVRLCSVVAVGNSSLTIKAEHIHLAFDLVTFFIQTAKNTFIDLTNQETIQAIFEKSKAKGKKQKVIALLDNLNGQLNSREISVVVGCSKRYVNNVKKERNDDKK